MSLTQTNVWKLEEAMPIAHFAAGKLAPHCELIDIAGSIRRKRTHVGDIEIVCAPRRVEHFNTKPKSFAQLVDLFSEPAKEERHMPESIGFFPENEFIQIVNGWTKIKGEPTGRYTQRIIPPGIKLDLFMTTVEDYYRQLVIRTGSADFTRDKIAKQWVRKGYRGTEEGLRQQSDCVQKNEKWVCLVSNPKIPPAWKSEQEFFSWLGIGYVRPEERY